MDGPLVVADRPGGTNTSHTIGVDHLRALLAAVPQDATKKEYERIAVEENVLGRTTQAGRARTFRYLRELYLLDPQRLLFRALRDLWDEEPAAQPLLACLAALTRDSVYRATADHVLPLALGSQVTAEDLTRAVEIRFPGVYNTGTAGNIGRNTASSWTQSGHLDGRRSKRRSQAESGPVAATYALLLGHLQGLRGETLFESFGYVRSTQRRRRFAN